MLVLTRKVGERIVLGDRIVLEVLQIKGPTVRIGIAAPGDVHIVREELLKADTPMTVPVSRGPKPVVAV